MLGPTTPETRIPMADTATVASISHNDCSTRDGHQRSLSDVVQPWLLELTSLAMQRPAVRWTAMARKVDILAALLDDSSELEETGRAIQGSRELLASEEEIEAFVERYHEWFGRAVNVVPEEFRDRLRAEFNGSWHAQKIKKFLEAPGEVSIFGQAAAERGESSPLPYWSYPYDTTFHGPLLAQRQILVEAQQALLGSGHGEDIEVVERICRGFGELLIPLSNRQRGRPPIVMEDEYDVQDFLHGLLRIFFDDIRPEDYSPERAGARSRIEIGRAHV